MRLTSHRFFAVSFLFALLSTTSAADDLFLYLDQSGMLPEDASENLKDTLDVELADIDGDGDLDLFVIEGSASAVGFQNLLWINDGTGQFSDETILRLPLAENNSTEIDLADVDADGDLDAVVANLGANQLLLNNGSGVFSEILLPGTVPPGPPGFAVPFPPFFIEVSAEAIFADVNNDSYPDILISNENPFPFGPPGDANRLLINDGSGNFADESFRLPFTIDNTAGIAPGDIDSDGDLDLIIGNIGQNKVYINNGSGVFTDETDARLPIFMDSTRKVVLGDIDNDGDADLVVGNSRREQNRLYINNGHGVFTDATVRLPVDTATTTDIDLVDLDGNGVLDVLVTNVGDFVFNHGFLGEPNRLYLNDGSGFFTDLTVPRLPLRDGRTTNAEIGDVDGNGTLDIVFANSGGVDQPGLPPPDGAERLYLRTECELATSECHHTILDEIALAIANLSTETFPTGDMSSANVKLNLSRKQTLAWRLAQTQRALALGQSIRFREQLRRIERRVDNDVSPPDWVLGEAADSLQEYANFSLEVFGRYGL